MNDLKHSRSISTATSAAEVDAVPVGDRKRQLTLTFLATGWIAIALIVLALTAGGYYVVRTLSLHSTVDRVADEMHDKVMTRVQADQLIAEPKLLRALGEALVNVSQVKGIAIYGANAQLLWSSSNTLGLSNNESTKLPTLSKGYTQVFDVDFLSLSGWQQALSGASASVPALIALTDAGGKQFGIAKVLIDPKRDLRDARNFGLGLCLAVLLATLLLFFLLYANFKKGVQTIEKQEEELNHQISRLSNLLLINKSMQSSIKTASARAVELNEQFLRRTGADLHDGPAQMIGFAAMRLNKLSKDDAVKSLGHEFHGILEALEQSLDEIRGISSGLVLPELANMTFEQCLRKVVVLHGTKSDAEVAQFHADVPSDIALPIKICAYRFLQEGLTNAERHGKAEKCRLRTSFRDGVLEVSLKDNGMGFRKSQLNTDGGHLGLVGMKDRIESIGGKFNINSELGVGTALKFSVDLREDL